jgi:aspartyl-tRNA(Asn)/glutamyl-tRNA(Gln) amidotransferase subunit A
VALGLVAVALGSDTGGSIRLPVACCGVVGFKPTQGAVPLTHAMALSPTQDCIGLLAHTVGDAALILRLISDLPWQEEPVGPAGLRLGLDGGGFLIGLAPGHAGHDGGCPLPRGQGGAQAFDLDLAFFDALAQPADVIAMSVAAALHAEALAATPELYGPQLRARLALGATHGPEAQAQARHDRALPRPGPSPPADAARPAALPQRDRHRRRPKLSRLGAWDDPDDAARIGPRASGALAAHRRHA